MRVMKVFNLNGLYINPVLLSNNKSFPGLESMRQYLVIR